MGAEISQIVKSDLEGSTLEELLSKEEFVQVIREAVPVLDPKMCKTLRKILPKGPPKQRSKRNKQPRSTIKESTSSQDTVIGASAREDDLQEASDAFTKDASSGVTTVLSTTLLGAAKVMSNTLLGVDTALSTTSDVVSPTISSLPGEEAPPVAASRDNERTQSLWDVKEDEVSLPSEIADSFESWKADPSVFFRGDSSQAPMSLTEHYDYALSVRSSAISNKILWRFITTAYYDAISERSHSSRYSITKQAVAFAAAAICQSSSYTREVVEANLISWARDGARNRALADKLGSTGCYFYYPQSLSEWIWVKHLPLSAYDKAAKLLKKFGILEKAQESGAVELARGIETILKRPFQSTIPVQSQGEWILPISPQQTTTIVGGAAPREHASRLQKRESETEASPRKRQRSETSTSQNPYLPPPQIRQDLVSGDEQATDTCSPAYDSFASPSNTTRSQSIDSSTSATTDSQSPVDHINYEQIDQPAVSAQDSPYSHYIHSLLSLICAVGAIPKIMLQRALCPQKRWDEYGVEYQINPRNAHLEPHLRLLFLDSDGLWQVLQHLVSITAVNVEITNDMEEVYFCSSTYAEYLNSQKRSYWVKEALWLFCYVFPRNPTTLSASERERLWAVLEVLLSLCAEVDLEIPANDEVVETFLAVAKVGPLPRRRRILSVVDPLLKKTRKADLLAEGVHQRSVVLRLRGDIASSNELLKEFLDRADITAQLKSHSILGLLHLSQAANDTYNLDFSSASKRAKMWIPSNIDVTEKQLDVVWNQIHCAGRILRGQGQFETASVFFERCLHMEPLRKSKRHLAMSHLADTYVEVDYLRRQNSISPYAGELLSKAQRLIKTEIEENRFDEAHRLLMELCDIYGELVDPDIIDRHGHLRAFISLARISSPPDAESSWTTALNLGRKYYPLEEEVFVVALMHLFICTARVVGGDMEGGKAAFDYAAEICHSKSPQFVMPGLGTYLFDDVQCQIQSLVGWELPPCN
ncbi:hypothetical protein BU24DRAFT_387615 [Aaosphaeria arxii CBS 175.79]|uniref:Uncharacterized protein n=1 Tax=Aaosphaeria arxii CBS 175.79 TaxID=1450172 RepID=A0A6A5Y423_9PLEO|nr:uncharacterized protein BU24DRAFT_387615 [Aaosphaeria arxii CBS 175.79]KAF2020325.1 hypothetical protein BU24DRAFT_387615 [Aaosphaeria arxii CBS 175.79]